MPHPRGRLLGGSSAINSFALIYPSEAGADAWVELGNKGWEWSNLAPYYAKFQTLNNPSPEAKEQLSINYLGHNKNGFSGPIQASFPGEILPQQQAWINTFQTLGMSDVTDPLMGNAIGGHIASCHVTHDTRERSHAGNAYFDPVRTRSNLHLHTNATVQKIIFEQEDGQQATATGISYLHNGHAHQISARREVILAAGAFGSPQLLELSGIGSPTLFHSHGIEVVYDNANVGENLQDHVRSGLSFEAADHFPNNAVDPEVAQKQYEQTRTGPYAHLTCHTFAYMPLSTDAREALKPSIDKYISAAAPSLSPFERIQHNFIRRMIESPTEATTTTFLTRRALTSEAGSYITVNGMLAHPFSRGSVHITSPSIHDKPKIDFKYYSHPLDAEVHAHHLQFYKKLAATEPLASFLKPGGKILPLGHSTDTIPETAELIRNVSQTNYHPCGTCAMMDEKLGGVVDNRLKVYGTSNVRVVDASVFPIIPRGNIIATVYAVAEKAADIISEDLGLKRTS